MTESFRPGTRNSERKLPPKILLSGELVVIVPEDRVTAAFCFGPTSSHPFSLVELEPARLAVSLTGEAGPFVGVAKAEVVLEELACIT